MIAQYDSRGMIIVTYNDPVPPEIIAAIEASGQTFVNLPPLPGPPRQKLDFSGEPVFEDDGVTPVLVDGNLIYQSVSCDLHYVKDGQIFERPSFAVPGEIRLAIGEVASFQVPTGSTLIDSDNSLHTIDDGVLEFEGDAAGSHKYRLENFPYRSLKLEVIVE